MILAALTQLYEDLFAQGKIAPPGWTSQKIHYAMCINERGELEQVTQLTETTETGKRPLPMLFDLPAAVRRTTNVRPNFLWDSSSYALGFDTKNDPERTERCFEAFKLFHHKLLDGLDCDAAKAILAFLDGWDPEKAKEHPALHAKYETIADGSNLLFCVNGEFAHEDTQIRKAWISHYEQQKGTVQQCLVTGKEEVITLVHSAIKGLPGAQSSGASFVTFNAPAFCSFEKKQGANAPIGTHAAFAYTSALNYLLAGRKERLGASTLVCWADGAGEQYQTLFLNALFGDPASRGKKQADAVAEEDSGEEKEDTIAADMEALASGNPIPERGLDPECVFHVLTLSPNGTRISVRFYYVAKFGCIMKNIKEHIERMEIEYSGKGNTSNTMWALLNETANQNTSDKTPDALLSGAIAKAIISGEPYPERMVSQIILRVRQEYGVNRGKAALIKAYYLKNKDPGCPEEVLTVALNENCTDPAYTLGRVLSLYEAAQKAAAPRINVTLKDKYYGLAAATPAAIFPTISRLSHSFLCKLKPGLRWWYENQINELLSTLEDGYPAQFTEAQQAAFNLGYYHQTQQRYKKKGEESGDESDAAPEAVDGGKAKAGNKRRGRKPAKEIKNEKEAGEA